MIHNFHPELVRGLPVLSVEVSVDREVYVQHETALK
jgi:hypothetical protein